MTTGARAPGSGRNLRSGSRKDRHQEGHRLQARNYRGRLARRALAFHAQRSVCGRFHWPVGKIRVKTCHIDPNLHQLTLESIPNKDIFKAC